MVPEKNTFLTTEEVSKLLHCSTHYISKLRKVGLLIGTRYGKRWLYTDEDIYSFQKLTHGKDLRNITDKTPEAISREYGC